ncbi:hypothetical protein SCHPADRAFT_618213 [Schizopora paradoxa]|uniref:Mid2 domain-containing protein n=1 Tax=Schizopora paradoxa TaxID=27342 RepID=A0A0H2RF43_9AGAM|nr:hypothetical protein SCHPADRAFT_618213 [Schizopora paradoxa]
MKTPTSATPTLPRSRTNPTTNVLLSNFPSRTVLARANAPDFPSFMSDSGFWSEFGPWMGGASSAADGGSNSASTIPSPSHTNTFTITSVSTYTASATSSSSAVTNDVDTVHNHSRPFSKNAAAIAGVSIAIGLTCVAIGVVMYLLQRRRAQKSSLRASLSSITPFAQNPFRELESGTGTRTSNSHFLEASQTRETQVSIAFQNTESPPGYSECFRYNLQAAQNLDNDRLNTADQTQETRVVGEKRHVTNI